VGLATHGTVAIQEIDHRAIDLERDALTQTTSAKHVSS
jgi:hypothetical protein